MVNREGARLSGRENPEINRVKAEPWAATLLSGGGSWCRASAWDIKASLLFSALLPDAVAVGNGEGTRVLLLCSVGSGVQYEHKND